MKPPIRFRLDDSVCDAYFVKNMGSSALHGHQHFLLTLVTRGEGVQILNGTEIPFSPRDLFLLSPADFHQNVLARGETYDYYGVKFPYELLDSRLSSLASLDRFPLHVRLGEGEAAEAEAIFARLVAECAHSDRMASAVLRRALVEQLFILALRALPTTASGRGSAFVNRALGYLYSHFGESIGVSDAAAYIGYTPNYFNSLFREAFGVPFGVYLRGMRLSYAHNLLSAGGAGVTEAAAEAGFLSLSHFSRAFKEEYGVSPARFKREASAAKNKNK